MVTDKKNDIFTTVDRILTERLEQYKVPAEIRNQIRQEILSFLQRPEKKPFGACVLTPEASMAADQARKAGKTQEPDGRTPKII